MLLLWLLALIFGGWIIAKLPLSTISQSIAALTWQQWIFWCGLNFFIIYLSAQRWWLFTDALKFHTNVFRLLIIRHGGQTVNFITPGPKVGGEPLQILWLSRQHNLPVHKVILSLGLDRFYEVTVNSSVLLLCVALLVLSFGTDVGVLQKSISILITFLVLIGLLVWLLFRQPLWLNRFIKRVTLRWQHHPRWLALKRHWHAFNGDLFALFNTQKSIFFSAFVLSILSWVGLIGELELILYFLDIHVSFPSLIFIMIAIRLALLLPIPGGIGTIEASVFWSFQTLGLSTTAAVGLIALMRLRDAAILVAGLLCLWKLRSTQRHPKAE